jgi:hypothetical protein
MNIDDFDELVASIDDVLASGVGVPTNDTGAAIEAMLHEYVLDHETAARWLVGCLMIAMDHVGRSKVDVADALSTVASLTPCELSVVGFEKINVLLGEVDARKKVRRRGTTAKG